MRALLYDVHGNLPALEAVLGDAEAAGASSYVLGGDYVVAGGWARETLERLRTLEARWIRGNTERWLVDRSDAPPVMIDAIDACAAALGDDAVAQMAGLEEEIVLGGVHFCHGSPGSDMLSFFPERAGNEDDLLAGAREQRLVFGHTHLQFERPGPGGIELVNPGSIGMPYGRPGGHWALLDHGSVSLHCTEVDVDAACAQVVADSGYPDARAWVDEYLRSQNSDADAIAAFGPRDGRR
ncbi:MAG: metallophosphoesterase family protein [Gaiellaceae bacterium]